MEEYHELQTRSLKVNERLHLLLVRREIYTSNAIQTRIKLQRLLLRKRTIRRHLIVDDLDSECNSYRFFVERWWIGEERVLYPGLVGGELAQEENGRDGIPYHPEVTKCGLEQTAILHHFIYCLTLDQVPNWFEEAAAIGHPGYCSSGICLGADMQRRSKRKEGYVELFDVSAMDPERRARLQKRAQEEGWICHGRRFENCREHSCCWNIWRYHPSRS